MDRSPILELGHPVLRQVADPIALPIETEIQELIGQLLAVMEQNNGVGIAAPQMGRSQQLMIIASRPNLRYPTAPSMTPLVMINPEIVFSSDTQDLGWEGCLSIPGIRGQISRASTISVRYNDLNNCSHQQDFHGFVARIIQHEWDHLQGKVFLDRVLSPHDLMSEAEYIRQIL